MLNTPQTDAEVSEALSELVDGELRNGAVARACDAWRTRESARADWHAYQLIGDVLRSDDLASTAAHDADFLNVLRGRLALEPVVLAPPHREAPEVALPPAPLRASRGSAASGRWAWVASSAVAASFVVVASVLLLPNRDPGTDSRVATSSVLSGAPVVGDPVVSTQVADSASGVADAQSVLAGGTLIRDARLDQYLAAHKQFATTSALGVPSGFLRNAAADAPGR